MNRPWQIWLLFAACVLGAAAGMAWLTQQALRADERRRAAEAEAELEQRVSLALWRMDTELAPIIAEEVIRPPGAFRPNGMPVGPPPYVLLQFEARPDGIWTSPQQPAALGKGAKQAAPLPRLKELSAAVQLPRLIAELPKTPLPTAADAGRNQIAANSPTAQQNPEGGDLQFFEGNTFNAPPAQQQEQDPVQQPQVANAKPRGFNIDANADFQQRSKRYQSATQQSLLNEGQRGAQQINAPPAPAMQRDENPFGGVASEQVGVSRPVWEGDRLLLVRRVSSNGETFVQGSWLDWKQLKTRLLGEAKDLLPAADLAPVNGNAADDPSRMLAGLPVRLMIGEAAEASAVGPTLRWALTIGWGAVLLAVAAAAFLLQGVITLSERRAAFVSSVTHELRTPLTTFRMYAEMLARGMVPDANRRQEYFTTLQHEAERLTLLVENVLAYARLERGRKPQAQDQVTLKSLLDRVGPRLKQRASQAGMDCVIEISECLRTFQCDSSALSPEGAEASSRGRKPPEGDSKDCISPEGATARKEYVAPSGLAKKLDPVSGGLRPRLSDAARSGPYEGTSKHKKPVLATETDREFTTDQAVVEQILFNLVDNAAKYARDATDRRIHIEGSRNGKCVRLVVRDHGPGIAARLWSRPMQPFGKSAQESAESAPGVGLGLALCRRLAKQLGGRLEVNGSAGEGASVTLTLPMNQSGRGLRIN